MFYTSYFSMISKISENNFVPIAICGSVPEFYTGKWYRKLAPSWSIFSEYKVTKNCDIYTERFNNEILLKLDPQKTYNELCNLADESGCFVLICYEKPGEFCHRHLVSKWFNLYGYPCQEWVDPFLF